MGRSDSFVWFWKFLTCNFFTNCIEYLILKWTKQLPAPRCKRFPDTEAQEVVFSPKTLSLPQPAKSFPHLPAELLNPLQSSSSTSLSLPYTWDFSIFLHLLSMCYVTTTIFIWCITLWSLYLAHAQFLLASISRPVTIPGTCSKLFVNGLLEAPCDFHGSRQILHCSYLSSKQLLLINLSRRLSFCLLSCSCLLSLTLWWEAGIYSTQSESQRHKISIY